jgi:sugar phosphate isomerase/epimerase
MRLGISSYTFVWAVGVPGYPQPARPLTVDGLLDKAADLGVKVVQIADNLPLHQLSPGELDRLAERASKQGVDLEVGTAGLVPDHLQQYLSIAVRLHSPFLRVVIDSEDSQPSPYAAAQMLEDVLPEFRRAGVCLAIENHDRFPASVLAALLKRAGEGVGICLDTANSLACGEDVHSVLRVLAPWVVNVHIKDFFVQRLPHKKGFVVEGRKAGCGALNIAAVIDELRAAGGDPNLILELWPPPESTIEESIAKEDAWARESIAYLRDFVKS